MAKKQNYITTERRLRIGDYEPIKVEKRINETTLPLKEGEVFWTIKLDNERLFDVKTQEEAEIISRLVIIDNNLKICLIFIILSANILIILLLIIIGLI